MTDNRDIVKAARMVARDPTATFYDLRGALKGMLSLYDELNATTFSRPSEMVSCDPAPDAARGVSNLGKTYKL